MWKSVLVVCVFGCRPLGPGETRCTSTPVFGTVITNCKTGAPAYQPEPEPRVVYVVPASAAPSMVAPSPGPRWWWCADFAYGSGLCFRGQDECNARRDEAAKTEAAVPYCSPQRFAVCFRVRFPDGSPGGAEMCHPNLAACAGQRDFVLEHPERALALSDCTNTE